MTNLVLEPILLLLEALVIETRVILIHEYTFT